MRKLICISLLIVSLFLTQCGQQSADNYLLVVDGKYGVSREQFMQNFQLNKDLRHLPVYKSEDLKNYLDKNFLPNYLLLAEGYAQGIHQDSSLQKRMALQARRLLIRSNGPLLNHIQPDTAAIDSIKLEKYFQQQAEEFKIAHILVKSRSLADSLASLLQQGANYDALALEFSSDLQTASRGGDFFQPYIPGTLSFTFDSTCAALTPGQISSPVRSYSGYHLIKLFKRNKRPQNNFTEERRRLELQMKRLRLMNAYDQYHQTLFKKYNLIINNELSSLFSSIYQFDDVSQMPRLDIKRLNEAQLNLIIARYDGGSLTVAQVIEEYFNSGRSSRIPLRRKDEVEDYIRLIVLDDLKFLDAKKLKLDQMVDFKNEIEFEKQQMIIKQTRQFLLNQKIQISEEEVKNYYQTHPDEFAGQKYEDVQILIKNSLQGKKYVAELDNLYNQLRNKYEVTYNEDLIKMTVDDINQISLQTKKEDALPAAFEPE